MLKIYLTTVLCYPLLLGAASQAPLEQNFLEDELSHTQLHSFLESAQGKVYPSDLSNLGEVVLSEKDTENILFLYPFVTQECRTELKKLVDSIQTPLHDKTLDTSSAFAVLDIRRSVGLPADHVILRTLPMLLEKNGGDFTKEEALMSLEALIDLEVLFCRKANEAGILLDNEETRLDKIAQDRGLMYTQDVMALAKKELKEDSVIPDPIRTIPHIKRLKKVMDKTHKKGLPWVQASNHDRFHSLNHLWEVLLAVQGRLRQHLDVQCISADDIIQCRRSVQDMLGHPAEQSEKDTKKQRTPKYLATLDYDHILKNLNGLLIRLRAAEEAKDTTKQDEMCKRISGIIQNLHKRKRRLLAHYPQNDVEGLAKSHALAEIENLLQQLEFLGFSTGQKNVS